MEIPLEDDDEFSLEDLMARIKAEGLYLKIAPDGALQIHGGTPRDETLELIQTFSGFIIDWLSKYSYLDS